MRVDQRKELYEQAMKQWGITLQMVMLMEECAELTQATSKLLRKSPYCGNYPGKKEDWVYMADEIADVEIMIEQFKLTVKPELLADQVERFKVKVMKLDRLKKMLDGS